MSWSILVVILVATWMAFKASERIVAVIIHIIMLVVHVIALVLAVVTVGAGKDRIIVHLEVASCTVIFVLAMVASLNGEQELVIEGGRCPGCVRVTGGAIGTKVILRLVVRMTADTLSRRVDETICMTAQAVHIEMGTAERKICCVVVEAIRTPVDG